MTKLFISGSAGFGGKAMEKLPSAVVTYIKNLDPYTEILVGDCQGVDTLVQTLVNDGMRRVTVYCSGSTCRNCINKAWTVKRVFVSKGTTGRAFFAVKDRAMADDANCGLAIWDGKSHGTKANIDMLTALGKPVKVYRTDIGAWQN